MHTQIDSSERDIIMELSGEWCDYKDRFDEIKASGLTEAEQLAVAFGAITRLITEDAVRQVELARASQDKQEAVKHQIKLETMKHARRLFATCYGQITGKRAWDDED